MKRTYCTKCGRVENNYNIDMTKYRCFNTIHVNGKNYECRGTYKEIGKESILGIQDEMLTQMQNTFDEKIRPLIIAQMKRFKIKRLYESHNYVFIVTEKGDHLSKEEFCTTLQRTIFYNTLIEPWKEDPFCSIIYIDIKL